MKNVIMLLFLIGLFSKSIFPAYARDAQHLDIDLDFDGKPDQVEVLPTDNLSEKFDGSILVRIRVYLGSQENNFFESFLPVEESMPVNAAVWNKNYLLIDFSYSSRRGSPTTYQIFRWNSEEKRLCLYVDTSGISGNGLENDFYPSLKQVKVFNGCQNISDTPPNLGGGYPDYDDYWKTNTNIKVKVTEEKAWLYDSPYASSRSKMYIIKGDLVVIKDYKFSQNEGEDWFLVEYYNDIKKISIIKWVKGKSIGLSLPN